MTEVVLPESDASETLAEDDLVPVFRPSEKDTSASNYGMRVQTYSDLMPEYRADQKTLEVISGSFTYAANLHALGVASTRLASPVVGWLKIQTHVTSLLTTTQWVLDAVYFRGGAGDHRSWSISRQVNSGSRELVEKDHGSSVNGRRGMGSTRIPASASGGWELQFRPDGRELTLLKHGSPPHNAYVFTCRCGYVLI